MAVTIVAEVGSTHGGKFHYAKELVDRILEAGADAIKFQLFPKTAEYLSSGNVWLDPALYRDIEDYAKEKGLPCSASVFDKDSFEFLLFRRPDFIKFSYSKKLETAWIEECLLEGVQPIVSCDIMTDRKVTDEATKLYCIPEYPVRYQIDFNHLFPRFDGFSDHTLGYEQTLEAVANGAQVIEKHVTLTKPDIHCPDSYFALSIPELYSMVANIRRMEK